MHACLKLVGVVSALLASGAIPSESLANVPFIATLNPSLSAAESFSESQTRSKIERINHEAADKPTYFNHAQLKVSLDCLNCNLAEIRCGGIGSEYQCFNLHPPLRLPPFIFIQYGLDDAKQHYRRAEFKQAISLYQQVLAKPEAGNRDKIEALSQLGNMNLRIGQTAQAKDDFQKALKLARESGDRQHEGRVLSLIAAVQRWKQEYMAALDTLKTSLAIAQQVKDGKGEARSRFFTGTVLYQQRQYPQALETLQQALKLAQANRDPDEMAHIYDWMALTFIKLKDLKQAEITIQQQQKLSQDAGYRLAEYDGLATLVSLQQQQKQTDLVSQTYQKQLEIAQAADNLWFQRDVLARISRTSPLQ
jgi:tetratricopeptide (TPR) repeat protein